MKVGDLVVRRWLGKPLWEMIGIIITKEFVPKNLAELNGYMELSGPSVDSTQYSSLKRNTTL